MKRLFSFLLPSVCRFWLPVWVTLGAVPAFAATVHIELTPTWRPSFWPKPM
jgi:hypothetical protein